MEQEVPQIHIGTRFSVGPATPAWLGVGEVEGLEGKLKELRAALVCRGGRYVAGQVWGGELKVCRDVGLWVS